MLMLKNISFPFLFMNLQIQQINNRIELNILYQTLYKNPDINGMNYFLLYKEKTASVKV